MEVRAGEGVNRLLVRCPARYVIVPDFFGDDMVFGPEDLTRPRLRLPAENFCLGLSDQGSAEVMCVWQSSQQQAVAVPSSPGLLERRAGKRLARRPLRAGRSRPPRTRASGSPASTVRASGTSRSSRPKMPSRRRRWIGNRPLRRSGGPTCSRAMAPRSPGSSTIRMPRQDDQAAADAGSADHPCCFEAGRAVVRLPGELQTAPGRSSLLVYALDRSRATPLTTFCPIDVLRNTLGVGPCEYILKTEGLATETNPTPDNVMTWVEKQFGRNRQKKAAEEIQELLGQMVAHVGHAQARIERYGSFAREVCDLCGQAALGQPGLADVAALRSIGGDHRAGRGGLLQENTLAGGTRPAVGRAGHGPDRPEEQSGRVRETRSGTPRDRRGRGSHAGQVPHGRADGCNNRPPCSPRTTPHRRRWPARSRPASNRCSKPSRCCSIPGGPSCSHVLLAGGFRGVGCSPCWHVRRSPRRQRATAASPPSGRRAENLFANASFEQGRELWRMDLGGKTAGRFTVDSHEAGAGQQSALLSIGAVDQWGVQFGQTMDAAAPGKTCTFAVLAKSVKGPVALRLEIERRGEPYDRAVASERFTVTADAWTELHVTFQVAKPFPQGWFAYVSCNQPDCEYRLDMFRLYEGEYVAYHEAARQETLAAEVRLFDTGVSSAAPLPGEAYRQASRLGPGAGRHDRSPVPRRRRDRERSPGSGAAPGRAGGGSVLAGRAKVPHSAPCWLRPDAPPGATLASLATAENGPGEVIVEAGFQSPGGKTFGLRYALEMGQLFVRTEPSSSPPVAALSVEAPCRFVVLPDFFADDIVVDAARMPVDSADLPSENFLLRMLPGGNAIVMSVTSSRDEDARIELSGPRNDAGRRLVTRSSLSFGKEGKIWVAVIEAPGVWHERDVAKDGGQADYSPGLENAVSGPVAGRLEPAGQADRQLGDDCPEKRRAVREIRLGERAEHHPQHPIALDHGSGNVSVSLLAGHGGARLSPTARTRDPLRRAGLDLSDQAGAGDPARGIHGCGRRAGDARRGPVRVHPRRGRAKAPSTKGVPPAPRGTRWPRSMAATSKSRRGRKSSRSCRRWSCL